jgi:hypothetical protein
MSMNKTKTIMTLGAIALALNGCGASGGNPTTPSTVASVSSNVLQFAVGTANYAGTTSLNVVSTYRQPSGSTEPGGSGTLVNSPTLTLPAAITLGAGTAAGYDASSTILTGPAPGEVGGDAITSTSQTAGSSQITSFGQSGGVFGSGIEPWNSTSNGDLTPPGANTAGTPFQVAPYPVPIYDATAGDVNQFVPWGGPPAFDYSGPDSVVGSSTVPSGTAGIPLGINVFDGLAPVAGGAYKLTVAVPANTGASTASASFTLPAVTTIPLATNPAFTADGTGGGTLAFTLPAGATEALVELIDFGAGGTGTPVYYTIEATASGTLTLPDTIGPGGAASTATGDYLVTQVVALDYDIVGLSYPKSSGNPKPTILGASGSDDLSISAATCTEVGSTTSCTSSLPLLKKRALQTAYRRLIR